MEEHNKGHERGCPHHARVGSVVSLDVFFCISKAVLCCGVRRWDRVASSVRVLLLGLVCGLVLGGCRDSDASKSTARVKSPAARSVKVVRVTRSPVERVVTAVGTLQAHEEAVLSLKVSGRLQQIPVDLGMVVRRGELLAEVEPQDYELRLRQSGAFLDQTRARLGLPLEGSDDQVEAEKTSTVKQARAKLDEAQKNRDRVDKLSSQGIISQSELETAAANFEVAFNQYADAMEEVRLRQAQLRQRRVEFEIARQQLADTRVLAPFDGVVQERKANLGEFLAAATPVITLVQTDPLRLRLEVPEREAARLRSGQRIRFLTEGDPEPVTGRVDRLSPSISAQSRMLVLESDIRNPGRLRPGSFVRAEILVRDQDPALQVPQAAVVSFAGIDKVIVVESGQAVERAVVIGDRFGGRVELVSGVKEGESVVLDPGGLQQGQPVVVIPGS